MAQPLDRLFVHSAQTQILFVDIQENLIAGSLTNPPSALAANAHVLASIGRALGLPMTFTIAPANSSASEPIDALRQVAFECGIFRRNVVGCFADSGLARHLSQHARKTLIIAGYSVEIGVLQAVLGAINAGYAVHVPIDVVGGRCTRAEQAALRQIEAAGGIVSSVRILSGFMSADFSSTTGAAVLAFLSGLQPARH